MVWNETTCMVECVTWQKWCPIPSLTATLTGMTVDLDCVSLIPGLVDAWGSLRYSWFVPHLLRLDGRIY